MLSLAVLHRRYVLRFVNKLLTFQKMSGSALLQFTQLKFVEPKWVGPCATTVHIAHSHSPVWTVEIGNVESQFGEVRSPVRYDGWSTAGNEDAVRRRALDMH